MLMKPRKGAGLRSEYYHIRGFVVLKYKKTTDKKIQGNKAQLLSVNPRPHKL